MTGSDILLDTNAAIAWMNESADVPRAVLPFAEPGLPLPVLAELEYGARNSTKLEKNLQSIENLLQSIRLVLPDRDTARVFGEILVIQSRFIFRDRNELEGVGYDSTSSNVGETR